MPIYKMLTKERIMDVEVGPPNFDFMFDNLDYRKLLITEYRQTEFKNLIWINIVAISCKFPFIRKVSGFYDQGGE